MTTCVVFLHLPRHQHNEERTLGKRTCRTLLATAGAGGRPGPSLDSIDTVLDSLFSPMYCTTPVTVVQTNVQYTLLEPSCANAGESQPARYCRPSLVRVDSFLLAHTETFSWEKSENIHHNLIDHKNTNPLQLTTVNTSSLHIYVARKLDWHGQQVLSSSRTSIT